MNADHSSICKFTAEDPASELVLGTIAMEIERVFAAERTSE